MITHAQGQVLWSTASSLSVTSATPVVSDEFTLDDSTVGFDLTVYVDNAGSPTSGDTATFRILWTTGDILGDTGNDYDSQEHSQFLATLDTVAANTPGEDSASRTLNFGMTARKFKVMCTCPNAASRNMTIRARVEEHRAA